MILTGYTVRVTRDITPEDVIAPEHAASGDPALFAAHCLEAVDPTLAEIVREGDVLVVTGAVHNGAQAEDAILALQSLGIAAIVCREADTRFINHAGSFGLPILVQATAAAALQSGVILRLDLARGQITDQTSGATWACTPCGQDRIDRVQRTQLLIRMRRVVEEEGFAE